MSMRKERGSVRYRNSGGRGTFAMQAYLHEILCLEAKVRSCVRFSESVITSMTGRFTYECIQQLTFVIRDFYIMLMHMS